MFINVTIHEFASFSRLGWLIPVVSSRPETRQLRSFEMLSIFSLLFYLIVGVVPFFPPMLVFDETLTRKFEGKKIVCDGSFTVDFHTFGPWFFNHEIKSRNTFWRKRNDNRKKSSLLSLLSADGNLKFSQTIWNSNSPKRTCPFRFRVSEQGGKVLVGVIKSVVKPNTIYTRVRLVGSWLLIRNVSVWNSWFHLIDNN